MHEIEIRTGDAPRRRPRYFTVMAVAKRKTTNKAAPKPSPAKRPAEKTPPRRTTKPAADEAEARRIIKEVLATDLAGRKLESVCFHFGDDVACYLLYVNLPLLPRRAGHQAGGARGKASARRLDQGRR